MRKYLFILFLFSLTYWQVAYYDWGGIQHYTIFFFSILTLFAVTKAKQPASASFFLRLLGAIPVVVSFRNGFLALILPAFILLIQRRCLMPGIRVVFAVILLSFVLLPISGIKSVVGVNFNA